MRISDDPPEGMVRREIIFSIKEVHDAQTHEEGRRTMKKQCLH